MKEVYAMKKLLCLMLSLLLILTLAACQKEKPAVVIEKTPIEPPVEGVHWGMTMEEVTAFLVESGLSEDQFDSWPPGDENFAQIYVDKEKCEQLAITAPVSPQEDNYGVSLTFFFQETEDDELLLASTFLGLSVAGETTAEQLTLLYGAPVGEKTWEHDDRWVVLSFVKALSGCTVQYYANHEMYAADCL